ncbi:hypothetical protein M0L39_RS02275 [Providencia rettgeri]|nr:hypothetical protein [Providencia rettgeri]EJD6598776.1 hypothetical protein [Providencia rettgeri]MCY0799911.1 hypothetical protein [Providencia rettgeri]
MSSLLKNIIYEITSDTNNINAIMRKCFYLACKLGDKDFITWVKNEVSGYTYYCEDIPGYRYRHMLFKGEFRKESGEREHMQLDPILLFAKEEFHKENIEMFFPPRVTGSISNIQYYIEHGGYHQVLMSDATLEYCRKFRKEKMECLSVYQEFPVGTLISVIENIKIRVLEIALELERKIPNIHEIVAIESTLTIDNEVRNIVNNVFNNTIHGNANIAQSSEKFTQNIQEKSIGIVDELVAELMSLKINSKDCTVIDSIIPHIESIKDIKNKKEGLEKVATISDIAANGTTVLPVVVGYIGKLIELFS